MNIITKEEIEDWLGIVMAGMLVIIFLVTIFPLVLIFRASYEIGKFLRMSLG